MNIHQLANFFMSCGHTVFGGYVRDRLLGKEPRDLDVRINKNNRAAAINEIHRLVLDLLCQGSVEKLEVKFGYGKEGTRYGATEMFEHHRFLIHGVLVDLVFGGNLHPDCNINHFTLVSQYGIDGFSVKLGILHGDLFKALSDLRAGQFAPDDGMSSKRKQKMLDKGFREELKTPGDDLLSRIMPG